MQRMILTKTLGLALVLVALIALSIVYVVGAVQWNKHEAKLAVMRYLQHNYSGLSFKITDMHNVPVSSSFISKAFTATVEAEIDSRKVQFEVRTNREGRVHDYGDTLIQEKLRLDVEADLRQEVQKLVPNLKELYVNLNFDAANAHVLPSVTYSRDMKWLSIKDIGLNWKDNTAISKEEFVHKSVQIYKRLAEEHLDAREGLTTNCIVDNGVQMKLDMNGSNKDETEEQLLQKVSVFAYP